MVAPKNQDVMIRVKARTDQAKKALSTLGRSASAAGGNFARMGTMAGASFAAIALAVPVMAVAMLGRFVIKSTKLFIDFNDTLMRTKAILTESGGVAPGFAELNEEIRRVGRETRFTAVQAGQAANALAVAGVSAEEMVSEKALENLVKFAIAGGVDIQTATDIGIAGVKGFGLEMEQLSRVSDVLVQTFTNANVTIVGLGEAMKFAAPISAAAGITIEETAAAIGALGNAGIRGTIAGTGLRMSMNKLLKPTFDARTAIESLGLNVFVMTEKGHKARNELNSLVSQMARNKATTDSLSLSIKGLNDSLADLSIEQRRNSLDVMKIRQRAANMNRDLTEAEISQIEKLESSNQSLSITQEELSIEQSILSRKNQAMTREYAEMNKVSKDLNKTVELQTTGITSLADMFDQLHASGATTAQVLEIFGVRGGTAVQALLAQREAFHELAEENRNAANRTMEFSDVLRTSAHEQFLLFNSVVQDLMITLGEPFARALVIVADALKGPLQKALTENQAGFEAAAKALGENLVDAFVMLIKHLPDIIDLFKALIELLPILVRLLKLVLYITKPFINILEGITDMLNFLDSDTPGYTFFSGLIKLVAGLLGILNPLGRILGGIGGAATEGITGSKTAGDAVGGALQGAAGGAMLGAAWGSVGGPIGAGGGAIIGGVIGLAAGLMEDGAYVNSPTLAVIGENGPEAVIPVKKRSPHQALENNTDALGMGGNRSVSVGNITIGPHMDAAMIRKAIKRELPILLREETLYGKLGLGGM